MKKISLILLLSSSTKHPDRLAAFNAGANAYLGKPYSLQITRYIRIFRIN